MKILIYCEYFAPLAGGVQTAVQLLAGGLANLNQNEHDTGLTHFEVTVATTTPASGMDDSTLAYRVIRKPGFARLFQLNREADVIHLAGPAFLPLLLPLSMRKPVVVEHHGFQAICPNGQLFYEPSQSPCPGHFMAGRHVECLRCNAGQGSFRSFRAWLFTFPRRWLCQHVAVNIVPTNWLASLLRLPRMVTVHHGLTQISSPPLVCNARSPVTFAFLGRLVTTKGARVLLEAARVLKERGFSSFRIKIVGDGPERMRLEELVRDFQLQNIVAFLGYIPNEGFEESLKDACTIVMPSLAGEVFGLVAAENMQRGRLVVASNIGALREVVGNAGLTFPPGDANALANCMQRVLDDPSLAERLGEEARKRVSETFREQSMVEQHASVYIRATSQ
jgi:glycosyltransferase involved in cell wall biosynthesis